MPGKKEEEGKKDQEGDLPSQVNPSKVLSQQLRALTITYTSLAKPNFKGNIIL